MKEKSLRWLEFALLDFQVAEKLLNFDQKYFGIVAYHAQQAAKKV
jgi:HEPN domain-containing protein